MAFDDVRLPEDIEIGAEGGPNFSTTIITLSSGQEQRVQNWSKSRATYTIGYGASLQDYKYVRGFFYNRRGKARGFRFKDWGDYQVGLVSLGVADGTTVDFYLKKLYALGAGEEPFSRPITRIVAGTLALHDQDNTLLLDTSYVESFGRIRFGVAPASGREIFATFEFDVPVRFDTDQLALTYETAQVQSINSIPLIEIVEDTYSLNGL